MMKKCSNLPDGFQEVPVISEAGSFDRFPQGVLKIEYRSCVDGFSDWALAVPGSNSFGIGVIVLHGHGSNGDQFFTWKQLGGNRDFLRKLRCGILTPNLRNNAWMSPEAVADLADLIKFAKERFNWQKIIIASGSMGGTGGLIFATHHPALVDAVIALGAATDLDSYLAWCEVQELEVCSRIAAAIRESYRNDRELMKKHSTLERCHLLTMPVRLCHGAHDEIIPVSQTRKLAGKLTDAPDFVYQEVWQGDHDSPMLLFNECLSQMIMAIL